MTGKGPVDCARYGVNITTCPDSCRGYKAKANKQMTL